MIDEEKIKKAVKLFLEGIGENPQREGLRDTPARVAEMCKEIFCGIDQDPEKELEVYFNEEYDEMVIVRDIPFYSICEHHLMPFYGKAHVAYIPKKGRLTGLSKLTRVLEVVSKRPQLQERITSKTADYIMDKLEPHGVAVVIEAEHMCMTMRGVKKPGSKTVTSAVRGIFRKNEASRAEVLSLIRGSKND